MLITLLLLLLILSAASLFTGQLVSRLVFRPKVLSYTETISQETARGSYEEALPASPGWEEVRIKSQFGYMLSGRYYESPSSDTTVIICHGHTSNLMCTLKYMPLFRSLGCSVLLYDHRYHGASGGDCCTMGYRESADLSACVDWVLKKNGPEHRVGTHGESMGAATVLLHGAADDRISFVIADCPFGNLHKQLSHVLRYKYHLPSFPALQIADILSRRTTGTSIKGISPAASLRSVKCPVFFIHGDADTFVPAAFSLSMFDDFKGVKRLYIAENARHADSFNTDMDRYRREIHEFLGSIGI